MNDTPTGRQLLGLLIGMAVWSFVGYVLGFDDVRDWFVLTLAAILAARATAMLCRRG